MIKGTIIQKTKTIKFTFSPLETTGDIIDRVNDLYPNGFEVLDAGLHYVTIKVTS